MEIRAKFRGRLAKGAFEHPIKLSERLEPDILGDFADAPLGFKSWVFAWDARHFKVRSQKAEVKHGEVGLVGSRFSLWRAHGLNPIFGFSGDGGRLGGSMMSMTR
jgi:hypothetical protein